MSFQYILWTFSLIWIIAYMLSIKLKKAFLFSACNISSKDSKKKMYSCMSMIRVFQISLFVNRSLEPLSLFLYLSLSLSLLLFLFPRYWEDTGAKYSFFYASSLFLHLRDIFNTRPSGKLVFDLSSSWLSISPFSSFSSFLLP